MPLNRAHRPAIELAEVLGGLLGGGCSVSFSNSGSEANEVAFKIGASVPHAAWRALALEIISRYRAYHGQTFGALAATGKAQRKYRYEPLAPGFLHVMPPDPTGTAVTRLPTPTGGGARKSWRTRSSLRWQTLSPR